MEIAGGVASIFHCATKLEQARVELAKARGVGKSDEVCAGQMLKTALVQSALQHSICNMRKKPSFWTRHGTLFFAGHL